MSSWARSFQTLLRGDGRELASLSREPGLAWPFGCGVIIAIGCAIYGFTLGLWRNETQSLYTALKFPLLVFLTCGGNVLLNGCLAQVLGAGIGFRQSTIAILMSFALMAAVLAAFAPIMLFLLWNTPPLAVADRTLGHSITLLAHVALIAWAGILGNHRLLKLLRWEVGKDSTARSILFSWLAVNLLLGSQISWILRPFIGTPSLPVQFLRDDPFRGNFFEAMQYALRQVF